MISLITYNWYITLGDPTVPRFFPVHWCSTCNFGGQGFVLIPGATIRRRPSTGPWSECWPCLAKLCLVGHGHFGKRRLVCWGWYMTILDDHVCWHCSKLFLTYFMWVVLEGASMIGLTFADPFHLIANFRRVCIPWSVSTLAFIFPQVHSVCLKFWHTVNHSFHPMVCHVAFFCICWLVNGLPGIILQNGRFHIPRQNQWCAHCHIKIQKTQRYLYFGNLLVHVGTKSINTLHL